MCGFSFLAKTLANQNAKKENKEKNVILGTLILNPNNAQSTAKQYIVMNVWMKIIKVIPAKKRRLPSLCIFFKFGLYNVLGTCKKHVKNLFELINAIKK